MGPIKLVYDPIVFLLAAPSFQSAGVSQYVKYLAKRHPRANIKALPEDDDKAAYLCETMPFCGVEYIAPGAHAEFGERIPSHGEVLTEVAGRQCYGSFGDKAGRKTNEEYLNNVLGGSPKHASIEYHPHFTFFIGGLSSHVAEELIRHYVGCHRDTDGSPSRISTRYTLHDGSYVVPPLIQEAAQVTGVLDPGFVDALVRNRMDYLATVGRLIETNLARQGIQKSPPQLWYQLWCSWVDGDRPKAPIDHDELLIEMEEWLGHVPATKPAILRKRVLETASRLLCRAAETSLIWTTNPEALSKLLFERADDAADLEFQRFARTWGRLALESFPNLIDQRVHAMARAGGWHPDLPPVPELPTFLNTAELPKKP